MNELRLDLLPECRSVRPWTQQLKNSTSGGIHKEASGWRRGVRRPFRPQRLARCRENLK
jgi:hypothetical protein